MKLVLPALDRDSLLHAAGLAVAVGAALTAVTLCFPRSKREENAKLASEEPPKRKIHYLKSCHPLFGDVFEILRNRHRMYDWMTEKTLEFNGEPWRIVVPCLRTLVMISTPDLVEDVTATQFDNFPRGEHLIDTMEDIYGRSIVTADFDKWRHQRKVAAKFFTARALREFMMTNLPKNMDQVYEVFDKSTAEGVPLDLVHIFHNFTLQTFAEVGLGIDMDIIGSDEKHPMDYSDDVTPLVILRTIIPKFVWKFERWLNIGPERQFREAMTNMNTWLDGIVKKSLKQATQRLADRQAAGKTDQGAVKSVVELFVEQSADDKEGLRAEDLVDFIRIILLASRGTTAVTLAWTFLMIAKHPHVEQRIRAEMEVELAGLDQDEYLTTDHVAKLTYLEATIKEVLRLYPTLPFNQKETANDTVIGGDLPVKKGEMVGMLPYVMARLPTLWGPDAAEFKPERWIDTATGSIITPSPFKFTTFSCGPRICIGMKLAMLELRIVMANLLRQYDFDLATPNDCGHIVSVELVPATPVLVNVTRRTSTPRE